jgi:SAM-dependent methyltransferase
MPATLLHYAYGDSDVAGNRLARLARVFGPSTATFLQAAGVRGADVAVDLGCGPGYTTELVEEEVRPARTVGLEASAAFVTRARREHPCGPLEFVRHDVTAVPFPVGPADVLFARYLLAHLPAPDAVVARWATQLAPGGRLLVEEIVAIETEHLVLARYVELVTAQSVAHGTDLLVGARLLRTGPPASTAVVHDQTVTIAPSVAEVAALFAMNLGEWRHGAWAQATVEPAELDALADALAELIADPPSRGAIQWRHRHLAIERDG